MVKRMTKFYFQVQLIPRSKCMDNFFFYLQYVLLQYSYYKTETTSFIFVKPNFFICKQFITGTVS